MSAVAERPQRAAISAGQAWAPAAVTITAAGLSLARLAATGDPFRTVWGEDGTVFLAEAQDDPAGSIITTYAGYAHLAPRLVALAGSMLPVSWWAALATLTSVAAVGALAGFVFVAAKRVTGRTRAALVAAAGLPLAGA
ncbi:MAG TPA: hypothetical protein VF314_09025, partial [Actinomycetes bacterium]